MVGLIAASILASHSAVAARCQYPNAPPSVVVQGRLNGSWSPVTATGKAAIAKVEVLIGPDGSLLEAKMYQSTGDARLDAAALSAARASTYAPALEDCAPVKHAALMQYDFLGGTLRLNDMIVLKDASAVAPPTIDVPPGFASLATSDDVASWTRGSEKLWTFGLAEKDTLDELAQDRRLALYYLYPNYLEQHTVQICSGTETAYEVVYTDRQRNLTAELYTVTPDAAYETLYTASDVDALDPAVEKALRSTCAPHTKDAS